MTMRDAGHSSRSCPTRSTPFMPGMTASTITASGRRSITTSRAASADSASLTSTSGWSSRRAVRNSDRISIASSTTRTRAMRITPTSSPVTRGPLAGYLPSVSGSSPSDFGHSLDRIWAEARFELLVQSIREYAIFRLDAEGRISSWNAGAERIKGYRGDEVLGQHYRLFYLEEEAAAGVPELNLEKAAREGQALGEGWRRRKDGSL